MCLLCGERTRKNYGPILTSLNCHLLCLKFSSGILDSVLPPRDVEVAREVRRVQKLKCVFCQEYGAFVGCNIKQCSVTYHLHCGQSHGCLNQYNMFSSYCPTHRPKNSLPPPPNPTPTCHLCSGLISQNKDLVVCSQCKTSLHIQCCRERVHSLSSSSSCPNCGESSKFTAELSFYGVWFRNIPAEKVFMRTASGPPSHIITSLTREVSQKEPKEGTEAMSSPTMIKKMSPMDLLTSQSSASTTPELSPIKDILEFVSDDDRKSREADSDSSRDSSPAYRRKVSKLPGRSPKKLVLKKAASKYRPRYKDTSATGSDEDLGTSKAMLSSSEKESGKTTDSSSGTVQPARKKVKLIYTDTSEGFLSDIDDILKGDVTDPETHPMRDAIFSPNNEHLAEIMVRLSEKEEVVDEQPKPKKTVTKKENKSGNKKKADEDSKAGKKKVSVKKPSPRKALLQKKTNKKFAEEKIPEVEEPVQSKKKKVTRRVRLLPLAERQIFHGRNWIPMTEAREEESDCNTDWTLKFSELRIIDIADINRAEGQIMKLWNLQLNKYHGFGVKNMDNIVLEFVTEQKAIILQQNLYRNLVAHLTNLHKADVISPKTILSAMNIIQTHLKSEGTSASWAGQLGNIEDTPGRSAECSTSTPVRSYSRGSFGQQSQGTTPVRAFGRSPSSSLSPATSTSKPSPLSRGMKIMNLSLSSQKSRDGGQISRLSNSGSSPASLLAPLTPNMSRTEPEPRTEPQDYSVPMKKPRLSDLSSNSSPGSLLLHLSDSSFSSHSSGIVKDESTLVNDSPGQ